MSLIAAIPLGSAQQSARLALLLKTISTALHDPAHNPTTALLVLGVAALVLLLVVAIVFLIGAVIEDWRNPPPPPVRRTRTAQTEAEGLSAATALVWAAVVAVVLVGITFGYRYGTSDAACARCHATKRAFAERATDTHAKVACSRCHVAPGAAGGFAALASGARNLGVQIVRHPSEAATGEAPVQNSSCLSCHGNVTTGIVVAAGTRMRHSDVLAVGYACTDCHSTVGHGPGGITPARYPTMAQCVQCHDGTKATSACAICHSRDVGVPSAQRATAQDIPKATIVPDGCRGCHSMKKCIDCHGIELPHSDQFKQGFHARKALLEPQVCVKCHSVTEFCNGCHQFRTTSGGLPLAPHGTPSDFVAWHVRAGSPTSDTSSISCSCHNQGGPRGPLCQVCHAKQPDR